MDKNINYSFEYDFLELFLYDLWSYLLSYKFLWDIFHCFSNETLTILFQSNSLSLIGNNFLHFTKAFPSKLTNFFIFHLQKIYVEKTVAKHDKLFKLKTIIPQESLIQTNFLARSSCPRNPVLQIHIYIFFFIVSIP